MTEERRPPTITASHVAGVSSLDSAHPLRVYQEWMNLWLRASEMARSNASLGGQSYDLGKNFAQYLVNATPEPWRSQMAQQLLRNKPLQDAMRSEAMAAWFEQMGQSIKMMSGMKPPSELFNKYNNQFLTEYSDGSIHAVSEKDILKLFPQSNEIIGEAKQMPRIIFTSSHARGETLKDVTGITHGIERMVKDATKEKVKFGYFDKGVKPNETIILYRCDVRENPWLNAASLMRRMHELDDVKRTGKPDTFKEASPGARAIERVMLAAMVKNPEQILQAGNGPFGGTRIELRDDAARVAPHFMQMGYSKGGNVVSDSLRMLSDDLMAGIDRGQPVFYQNAEHEPRPIDKFGVRSLMRQITTWAMASIEHELSPKLIDNGARRVAFNSTSDSISAHQNYEGNKYDERWMIEGVKEHNGHDPVDALGSRERTGYAMKDPRINRRMVELCAPMIGKATIAGARFDKAQPHQLIIETGAGTSDRLFKTHQPTILKALADQGLDGATIDSENPHSSEFVVHFKASLDSTAMGKLQDAFRQLREKAKGLVIAEDVKAQIEGFSGGYRSQEDQRRRGGGSDDLPPH